MGYTNHPLLKGIEALEEPGHDRYSYRLHDAIDTDILQMIVEDGNPDTAVSFDVKGYRVTVFGDGEIDPEEST